MKKRHILFCFLALFCLGSAMAQDTIHSNILSGSYYCNYWQTFDTMGNLTNWGAAPTADAEAFRLFSEDTIVVYGIAAAMSTMPLMYPGTYQMHWELYEDTTYKDVMEYLRLYEAETDSLRQIGEDLPVHITVTPVSYYLDLGLVDGTPRHRPLPILPMYERYFSEPVSVVDSFYVGKSLRTSRRGTTHSYTNMDVITFGLNNGTYAQGIYTFRTDTSTTFPGHPYEPEHYGWIYSSHNDIRLIFPILEPNPTPDTTVVSDTTYIGDTLIVTDTVIIGGDTIITTDTILSIQNGTLLDRLTGVMPNPAVGTAKVVSSFGMSMVEAYDMSGTLVHRQKADGLATTLDVRRWPTGTYLLRIHTPQGTATKKLVVRR